MAGRQEWRTVIWLAGSAVLPARALPAQQDSTIQQLEQQVEALDQRVRILDRLRELAADSAAQAARGRAAVSAGPGGFVIRSGDGSFQLRLRGYAQFDARFYHEDAPALTDNFLVRRARPLIEATVYRIFDFRLLTDFGGSTPAVFDAYFEARLRSWAALRAGKFKPPVSLERLQSATDLRFAERGFPTTLAPNRDIGLQLGGELDSGVVSYQLAVFNGVPDLGNAAAEAGDHKDVVGRVFLTPFVRRGNRAPVDLGFGIAASVGDEDGSPASPTVASYVSPGQQTVFRYRASSTAPATGTVYASGRRRRIYPQSYINKGPLGILGEYTISRSRLARDTGTVSLTHKAWQVAGSYFLTGEQNSFRSVTPRRPFDARGGWGAVELTARYGEIDFDNDAFPFYSDPKASVSKARAWAIGVNWYLARNVRITVDYERSRFEGGAGTATPTSAPVLDRNDETFIVTRFQTAF